MDPYLQGVPYQDAVFALACFAARVRTGFFGHGKQIRHGSVSTALSSIGKTCALAHGSNPTKQFGSDKLVPRLGQMLDGWRKEDPASSKKLPVEFDVPEFLGDMGLEACASEQTKAIGDMALIAFIFLLRVGEYTCKSKRNNTKQTEQFEIRDVSFFQKDYRTGQLREINIARASDGDLLRAHGATLRLRNQKNGWKQVCIFHEANGNTHNCAVRAIARRVIHVRHHTASWAEARRCPLSSYATEGIMRQVTQEDMSKHLKLAATMLDYPGRKGIPISRVDTHSLRGGGANALALSGYNDRAIMKMGRWKSATFMEYIRDELASYSQGMSKKMTHKFNFMNITGGVAHNVTDTAIAMPYNLVSDDEESN